MKKRKSYILRRQKNRQQIQSCKKHQGLRKNGKITSNTNGGETTYYITNYESNSTGITTIDNVRGLLKHSLMKDGNGQNDIDVTYENWEFKKIDSRLLRKPSDASFKSVDIIDDKPGEALDETPNN